MDLLPQALLEFLIQVIGSLLYDAVSRSRHPFVHTAVTSLVAMIVAALLSVLSLTIHPIHIIRVLPVRIAALATIPILNGCLLAFAGRRFTRRGQLRSDFEHFVPAFLFSLVFGAVRFIGAR